MLKPAPNNKGLELVDKGDTDATSGCEKISHRRSKISGEENVKIALSDQEGSNMALLFDPPVLFEDNMDSQFWSEN